MWGELFVTRRNRGGPGSEGGEALARVHTAQALRGEAGVRQSTLSCRPRPSPCQAPPFIPPCPRGQTLPEELARVRSQPDCLSFSEDVGCWEGASSVFLMETGGSEETCE